MTYLLIAALLLVAVILIHGRGTSFLLNMAGGSREENPCAMSWSRSAVAITEKSMEPVGDHILLRLAAPESKSNGGITLVGGGKVNEGQIVGVGPGSWNRVTGEVLPILAEPGARAVFTKYARLNKFYVDGVEHGILPSSDLLLSYRVAPLVENIQMPRGRVLVRVMELAKETASGIFLGKDSTSASKVGLVLVVAEGHFHGQSCQVPIDIVVGDVVQFLDGEEVKITTKDPTQKFMSVLTSECVAKGTSFDGFESST